MIKRDLLNIGSTEREILAYLWGRTTPARFNEVFEHVNLDNGAERTDHTYRVVLERMVQAGLVRKHPPTKRDLYVYFSAAVTREQTIEAVVATINSI